MDIQSISSAKSPGASQGASDPGQVTRDAFMKLLIAQLQNQDPLKPMENQEFVSQLTAFNSLDQLISLNAKMEGLQSKQLLLSQIGATSLIGKQIAAKGDQIYLQDNSGAALRYNLGGDAGRVVVNIRDAGGNLVRVLQLGNQGIGERSVLWDGKDTLGRSLPKGIYAFEVNALDGNGQRIEATSRTQGVVTGVDLSGNEAVLEIGSLKVPLSALISVQQ